MTTPRIIFIAFAVSLLVAVTVLGTVLATP